MSRILRQFVINLVVVSLLTMGGLSTASAAIIDTQDLVASEQRDANLDRINQALSRTDVQDKLVAMGVDLTDATQRAADLSDQELAQLAMEIDQLPAGQGAGEVLIVLIIVFLVLELTGVTNFF